MGNIVNEVWYDNFMQTLYEKYPKRSQLLRALMDILHQERETVYRRLRRDNTFSIHEIATIASTWNISLDKMIGINTGEVSFQMRKMNYIDPSEKESLFLQKVIQGINYMGNFPEAELMDICNKLPRQLIAGFDFLNQYYLFKWMYQYGNENEVIPFSQTIVSNKKSQLTADYYKAIKLVPTSNFILDRFIFEYLINDILYFHSIYLITDDEKALIKKDLNALLDYMFEVAYKGCYPETQNKVNLYISQISIDTNYSYVFAPDANICFIHVFEKFEIYTFNQEMVKNFINWMQLKKRTSVQISEVDEKSRIEFFTRQRQLLNKL